MSSNEWSTFQDIDAEYACSYSPEFDIFTVRVPLHSGLKFALCYSSGRDSNGPTFWDNNDSRDYETDKMDIIIQN